MGSIQDPNVHQVTGALLYAGYQYDDGLLLDLYGSVDDEGHHVESVAVSDTKVEIAQLFTSRQLENMARWLDLKDGSPTQREWAERHRHHAAGYS